MGDAIDSLNIEVQASAVKANDSIETLIKKLGNLSESLAGVNGHSLISLSSGVNRLSSSMQGMKNVGTADFTRLAKNLTKMGSVDSAGISNAAASVHQFSNALNALGGSNVSANAAQFGELAKGIAQLGYKSSTQAIENIPKLAAAMQQLMTTLAGAPKVSQNLIDMTNALGKLARTGASSGRAANSLSASLNSYTAATSRATKGTKSLASAFGKLYASYFLVFRGIKKIWQGVESSMDYVETFNYWNVTLDKIGTEFGFQFEKYGYESAESYVDSFRGRLETLTRKMTGYQIGESGDLTMTSGMNLGLDPEQLMNFQAKIGAVTNSVGLFGETSINTAKALSMLSADMSSFTNADLDSVMTNLQSGLIGQSRALYKYGIDITNATLATYAYDLGVSKAVTDMTQAEKMQLRLIAILDQSKVAWGDQANTLDSVANQYRILQQQFSNLARTLGNLFLPTVKTVLPVVNGLVISLNRLFTTLGFHLFGENWLKDLQDGISGGYGGDGLDDIADSAEDATGSLEDATNAAKKLKGTLRSFDELNVITTETDSGSGSSSGGSSDIDLSGAISDALADYESVWEAALANSENEAQKIADAICNAFKNGDYQGIGEYISNGITSTLNGVNWENIYKSASGFGSGFAEFLNGLITPDLFGSVGRTIAGALNTAIYSVLSFGQTVDWDNLGESIATGINEFFTTFDFGALSETLNTWVSGLIRAIGRAIQEIKWGEVLSGIYSFLSNLKFNTVLASIGSLLINSIGLKGIKNGTGLKGIPIVELPILISSFAFKFQGTPSFDVIGAWIIEGIEEAMEALLPDCVKDFIGKFVAGFSAVGVATGGNPYGALIGGLIASFPIEIDWKSVTSFDWTMQWFEEAKKAFMTAFDGNRMDFIDIGGWILEGILDGFVGAITFIIEPIARFFNELIGGIMDIFGIASPAKAMKPIGEYILLGIVEGFSNKVSAFNTAISSWFNQSVKPWFTMERWNALGNNAKNALSSKWNEFTSWWIGTGIPNWWNNNVAVWFTKDRWQGLGSNIKDGISTKWNEFTQWWSGTGFANWWNNVKNYFTKDKWAWSGISDGMTSSWNNAIANIKKIWNDFASWMNNKLNFKWDAVKIGGVQVVPAGSVNLGKIPTFEGGGFPEDGLFMANHGELVGKFSNGKTAVANNEQITQGIADAVYPAVYNAVSAAMKNNSGNSNVTFQVEGDPNGLFRVVRKKANEYHGRTGRPAFDF